MCCYFLLENRNLRYMWLLYAASLVLRPRVQVQELWWRTINICGMQGPINTKLETRKLWFSSKGDLEPSGPVSQGKSWFASFSNLDSGEKRSKLTFSLSIIPLNVSSVCFYHQSLVETGCKRNAHRRPHYSPRLPQQSTFIMMASENWGLGSLFSPQVHLLYPVFSSPPLHVPSTPLPATSLCPPFSPSCLSFHSLIYL